MYVSINNILFDLIVFELYNNAIVLNAVFCNLIFFSQHYVSAMLLWVIEAFSFFYYVAIPKISFTHFLLDVKVVSIFFPLGIFLYISLEA